MATSKAKRIHGEQHSKPAKLTLLYLFLLPLFISTARSLFASDYQGFLLKIAGFLLLAASISLARKGYLYKADYERSVLARAPKIPYLKLASAGLGFSLFFISFFIGGKTLPAALFTGTIAVVGFYLYYGYDPVEDKADTVDGISLDLVISSIAEANETLMSIQNDMQSIHDSALRNKLTSAVQKAKTILRTIEEDPKDIRIARKFLVVYIDGISKVTTAYTQLNESDIDSTTQQKLHDLLDDVQQKFDRELTRLKENNLFDLDVHIDTLKEQIKH